MWVAKEVDLLLADTGEALLTVAGEAFSVGEMLLMDDGELCMNATGLNSGLLALRELRAGFEIGVTGISCAFLRCGGVHCDFLTCSSTCSVAELEVATFLM